MDNILDLLSSQKCQKLEAKPNDIVVLLLGAMIADSGGTDSPSLFKKLEFCYI